MVFPFTGPELLVLDIQRARVNLFNHGVNTLDLLLLISLLYSSLLFPNPHLSRSVSPVPPSLSPPPFLDNEMLAPASLLSSKSTI